MIIERAQKSILLEEAAREGILHSNIQAIPLIYARLLGAQDLDKAFFGQPWTRLYPAVPGSLIDTSKLAEFTKNLYRDHRVLNQALLIIEANLYSANTYLWAWTQRLRKEAQALAAEARAEKSRVLLGSLWAYTETFDTTDNIDFTTTTAWIEPAEGIATLPALGQLISLKPEELTVESEAPPTQGSSLGSTAAMAFDGSIQTSWRNLFVLPGTNATATLKFSQAVNVTAISLESIGYGTSTLVELLDSTNKWVAVAQDVIFNKRTYAVDGAVYSAIRIWYAPSETTLPKVAGFRDIVIYTNQFGRTGQVYTKALTPTAPFSDIQLTATLVTPDGTTVSFFYSTDNSTWVPIERNVWGSINLDSQTLQSLGISDYSSASPLPGGYSIPVAKPSRQAVEGTLDVGLNQFEVSAFKKDWATEGDTLHRPALQDFETAGVLQTWESPAVPAVSEDQPNVLLQTSGAQIYGSTYNVTRGVRISFQRRTTSSKYSELCFVPLAGGQTYNTTQFSYNYKFHCSVFAPQETAIENCRYWFLQGYRNPLAGTYAALGKSYGSFSLFVNGDVAAGETIPGTVFSDNTIETGYSLGKTFILKLQQGWNDIDLLIYVIDPNLYPSDSYDVGSPYLQLNILPSLFDPLVQADYGLKTVLGSGVIKPATEFDLLWNLPKSPKFWAWSEDRTKLLLNANSVSKIDGYFRGSMPLATLHYRGISLGTVASDLYIRADLDRESTTPTTPLLRDFTVFVR